MSTLKARQPILRGPEADQIIRDTLWLFSRPLSITIGALSFQSGMPHTSTFRRYAIKVLAEAGGLSISPVHAQYGAHLLKPTDFRLARIAMTHAIPIKDRTTLLDVECAINRLVNLSYSLVQRDFFVKGNSVPIAEDEEPEINVSPLGTGFAPPKSWGRVPPIDREALEELEQLSEPWFHEVDWLCTDAVANCARSVFQASLCSNDFQDMFETRAKKGSDWDVRTRLASNLEHLSLPFRLQYRFDVDTAKGNAAVRFVFASQKALPTLDEGQITHDGDDDPAESAMSRAALVYNIRVATLLAAACFGTNTNIKHVAVTGYPSALEGEAGFSLRFERDSYAHSVLTHIDDGLLGSHVFRFDPEGLIALLEPEQYRKAASMDEGCKPLDEGMFEKRLPTWLDDRPLPRAVSLRFHAQRACDLDTEHDDADDDIDIALATARHAEKDSQLIAIAQFEHLVDMLESRLYAKERPSNIRFLHFARPVARASVPMLEDMLSIADEAEAFLLDSEGLDNAPDSSDIMYEKAPRALFFAYTELSNLYKKLGDVSGAMAMADKAIELGPTTTAGYLCKAGALAAADRYAEAANILTAALQFSVDDNECMRLYYELANVLWQLGDTRTAAAIIEHVAVSRSSLSKQAQQLMTDLKRQYGARIFPADYTTALKKMHGAAVLKAPSKAAASLVAEMTVQLANAGFPSLASQYMETFVTMSHHNNIVESICDSLAFGVEDR